MISLGQLFVHVRVFPADERSGGGGGDERQPATSITSPVQTCSNCMQHVIMDIEGGRRVVLIINPADTLAFKSPLAVRASDEISATTGADGRDWLVSERAVYGCQSTDSVCQC